MSARKPESPAWDGSDSPPFVPESPTADAMETLPRSAPSLAPIRMADVASPDNAEAFQAGADGGHGSETASHPQGDDWPAFTPDPLPQEWVLPPDVYYAFSHARPCPDVFAIHAPDAAQRLELLSRLAVWCSQERWWLIVPDLRRALELGRAWPKSAPRPLLWTHAWQTPAAENPPDILTLGELQNQITAQVRAPLQERLQSLRHLQAITLELVQCDTLQAELAATLETLEQTLQAEAEDEDSALQQTLREQLTPLQQRLQECEARRCQLQEKLRLEQSQAGGPAAAPKPPCGGGWFARLTKWLLGRSSSPASPGPPATTPSPPSSAIVSVHPSSIQEEWQAVEKEWAQLHALRQAEYQQLLAKELVQRRQALQERLDHQRAEHERLHLQRERLIRHLSLAQAEGPDLEQELAHVQRQLREADSLAAEHLQHRLEQVQIFLIPAREGPDMEQLRRLAGGVDRFIYESCEQIPDSVMRPAMSLPGRHLLIGNILPPPSRCWEGNGAVPGLCRLPEATPWPALLGSRLDQRLWVVEGEFLIARLRLVPPEQRFALRQEPLVDRPEVLLRFRDTSDRETELVEIAFPLSWGFAARAFVAQQLEHYRPLPCGPAQWHTTPAGDIRVCWPVVEQAASAHRSESIDWGNGVQEWCLFDGHTFYTAALTFRADGGWDRAAAEAWLQELLPLATRQRLAVVTSRQPLPPISAAAQDSSCSLHSAVDPAPESPRKTGG